MRFSRPSLKGYRALHNDALSFPCFVYASGKRENTKFFGLVVHSAFEARVRSAFVGSAVVCSNSEAECLPLTKARF